MLILYCVGFVCTLVAIRAFEEYRYQFSQPTNKQHELEAFARSVKYCGMCVGQVEIRGDKIVPEIGSYICATNHRDKMKELNAPESMINLFTMNSILGAMVWPISLPLTVFSFGGKYYGKIIYQKNLMKQLQIIQNNKEMEKYLNEANEEISKILPKGA